MSENLTLNIDPEVIEFANNFSKMTHKSLSRIIEDYLIELKEKTQMIYLKTSKNYMVFLKGWMLPIKKQYLRKQY